MSGFLIDHNVTPALRRLLAAAGHIAQTAWDLGLHSVGDDELLVHATRRDLVIVTQNRKDFTLLHDAWHHSPAEWGVSPPPAHAGILGLRQIAQQEAAIVASAISAFVGSGAVLRNEYYFWNGIEWRRRE